MNYQRELDSILECLPDKNQTLFLHSCCAPCSSYVLEYLSTYFRIIVFYYNPNISEKSEYEKRVEEQKRLIAELNAENESRIPEERKNEIRFLEGSYEPDVFFRAVKGLEQCKEGGERCRKCFELRLRETVKQAELYHADYVTTTLTISPLKNAEVLNEILKSILKESQMQEADAAGTLKVSEEKHISVQYLPSDFKKKNGYKRSCELSEEHHLYRQDYCGCIFSKAEREGQKQHIPIENRS